MLQTIYTILLGLLTTVFVQLGIATFYRSPKPPHVRPDDPTLSNEEKRDLNKVVEEEREDYSKTTDLHHGNVAMITLLFVIAQLLVGLGFANRIGPLADGILLGGIFSLAYGVGICFYQSNVAKRFAVVSAAFVIALVLGYLKFMPH